MSDIQLDLNEILAGLSAEVASMTKRAVIAEANVTARDRIIAELREEISALKAQLSVNELKEKLERDDIDFG